MTAQFDGAMAGVDTHEIVLELVDPPDKLPIADVGSGQGVVAEALTDLGYDVQAFGIDERQYRSSAPFVRTDLDRGIPVEDKSLDGILAVEIIEHLEGPLIFVRDAARALRSGGWMIVTTPNVLSWTAKLAYGLRDKPTQFGDLEYETNGHISPISLITLERMASRVGLTIEVVTYNVGKLPIPRLRHRIPLRGRFRNKHLGESLIVKFRKTGCPTEFVRG